MSQWGMERSFVRGNAVICVAAHVGGPPFEPLSDESVIDDLLMTHSAGLSRDADVVLFREVCRSWLGQKHGDWKKMKENADSSLRRYSTASGMRLESLDAPVIESLKPGDIVRHRTSGDGYIVTANNGNGTAVAVRTITLSNPSEWLLVSA